MPFSRSLNVVGCHAEGEVGDVVTGGVLDVPGSTMHDKMIHFWSKNDSIRQLLLNEPRGRAAKCANIIIPPCDPVADAGFLIMESEEWVAMSGSNTMCVTTVLLETGMLPMQEPITKLNLDTAAGLVAVTAECENGKCKSVEFENAPSFVFELDYKVEVPGLGTITVDIVYGGMMFALVDAASIGERLDGPDRRLHLVELGERIKRVLRAQITPVHPENPMIRGITNLVFTDPVTTKKDGKETSCITVVMPGRFDRSPCGTGTCARLAVLHARGQLCVGEELINYNSLTGSKFDSRIIRETTVGNYEAIIPAVKGRAWITGFKQEVLDSTDPYPEGFRVDDAWHTTKSASLLDDILEAHSSRRNNDH